jgi:hypothetical protein
MPARPGSSVSQSFNLAQVIDETGLARADVFLVLQAQQRGRMNGDEHPQSVRYVEDRASVGANRDSPPRQTLRRGRARSDDEPWMEALGFVEQPPPAY